MDEELRHQSNALCGSYLNPDSNRLYKKKF